MAIDFHPKCIDTHMHAYAHTHTRAYDKRTS